MISLLQNEEFIQEFVEEALTHIDSVENNLLRLEGEQDNMELVNDIFRAVHSIKGTAGFFGLENIIKLAHTMESLFGDIRSGKIKLSPHMIDTLLRSNDMLYKMVQNVEESQDMDISKYIDEIENIADEDHKEEPGKAISPKPQTQVQVAPGLAEDSIRVNTGLLNDLMDLASELVLGRNRLLRTLEGYEKDIPGLDGLLQNMDNITTVMQEKVMQTRMQPVGNIFNKFPRIIRDMARDLDKDIELTMEGTNVELDRSIIEALGDPLTHLVRNAADHGIESPKVRKRAGKERTGNIHLHAYHEAGYVTIDIIDDGAGIDIDTIKAKAIEKEIITQAEAQKIGDKEALLLLFAPGFSTAKTVTDVSGRGVGMDVVKTNIEKLGGSIDISTSLGEGTTFRLTLPLTLAIISSLIVEVGGQRFALPQINLQEMVRIKPGDKTRSIEYINESQVLRLRGKLLPLVHLSDILGLPRQGEDDHSITRVLVLKIGTKSYGLIVDSIQDGEEILVKSLPRYINECRAYSGVTIMGDGSIAMILDPQGIAELAKLKFIDDGQTEIKEPEEDREREVKIHNLILFKASGPETLAINLSEVARVDEIDIHRIEDIGDKEYINYRGNPFMIIRPEDYMPIQDRRGESQSSYLIIPKYSKKRVGILIEKIYDTVHGHIDIDHDDIKGPGIYGSTLIDNRVVLIVSIDELIELACPKLYAGGDAI